MARFLETFRLVDFWLESFFSPTLPLVRYYLHESATIFVIKHSQVSCVFRWMNELDVGIT